MEVRAQHKHARMSPRKVRLLRSVIRGLSASEARAQLNYLPGKAAELVSDVLISAVANADHNFSLSEDALVVADLVVDEGVTMKRFQPASRGMAHPILKRTSHITVVLEERGAVRGKRRAKRKTEIETLTAEQMLKQQATEEPAAAVTGSNDAESPAGALQKRPRDEREKAFQKKKMQQQGGDKAKTHRRKSLGDA